MTTQPITATTALAPAIRQQIEGTLSAHPVVLYMKGTADQPQCGFSARAAFILGQLGVAFHDVNVLADSDIREGIKLYSEWPTIPQLYVRGEFIGGADILTEMYQAGELHQLFGLTPGSRTPAGPADTSAA